MPLDHSSGGGVRGPVAPWAPNPISMGSGQFRPKIWIQHHDISIFACTTQLFITGLRFAVMWAPLGPKLLSQWGPDNVYLKFGFSIPILVLLHGSLNHSSQGWSLGPCGPPWGPKPQSQWGPDNINLKFIFSIPILVMLHGSLNLLSLDCGLGPSGPPKGPKPES